MRGHQIFLSSAIASVIPMQPSCGTSTIKISFLSASSYVRNYMPRKLPPKTTIVARPRAVPRQVRIIAGDWKRTPLPVLDAAGLRPTPDRVRETVFSWLTHLFSEQWTSISCLDLFAGSGALGFEAASRGAQRVVLVEQQSVVVQQLEAIRLKLDARQVSVLRSDAFTVAQRLAAAGERFDLVFLDPPYAGGLLERMLPVCAGLLSADGIVYAEAEAALDGDAAPDWMEHWEVIRSGKAGLVFFHLLQCRNSTGIQA
jgi:16S rRNA (guanine966-N2)-methyltransferase